MSYWNCVYFLMVTMSTGTWQNVCINNKSWHCLISLVGYGDIVCKTKMGRVLQLLSLLVGLVRCVLGNNNNTGLSDCWRWTLFTHRLSLHLSFLKSLSFWASKANGLGLTTEPRERGTTSACLAFGCAPSYLHPM